MAYRVVESTMSEAHLSSSTAEHQKAIPDKFSSPFPFSQDAYIAAGQTVVSSSVGSAQGSYAAMPLVAATPAMASGPFRVSVGSASSSMVPGQSASYGAAPAPQMQMQMGPMIHQMQGAMVPGGTIVIQETTQVTPTPILIQGSLAMAAPQYGMAVAAPQYGMAVAAPQYGMAMADPQYGIAVAAPQYGIAMAAPQYGMAVAAPQYGQAQYQEQGSVGPLEGWLSKRAEDMNKTWMMRWFTLQPGGILTYSKDDKGKSESKRIILDARTQVRPLNHPHATDEGRRAGLKKPFGFEIYQGPLARTWFIDAGSVDKRDLWLRALANAIAQLQGGYR